MQPEVVAHRWEALASAKLIREYVTGRTQDDYRDDVGLRDRVERRFIRTGEALSQASKLNPDLVHTLPDLPRIVAFRRPDHNKTKIGYENPLTEHFYVYTPPRPLEEIDADIKHLELEIHELLREVTE